MHTKVLVLFTLFYLVWSHDITIGTNTEGRKIFDETRQANPAIWRQYENVTVIAPDSELIGRVVITDMRPEKDGDVKIVDGGDGKKSVTIELRSPTVLRGYEFHIEVYSVPETVSTDAEEHLPKDEINTSPKDDTEMTKLPENATTESVPVIVSEDVNTNIKRPARGTEDEDSSQTNLSEEITTTSSYETSSSSDVDSVVTTTDLTDNFRPARETPLHTSITDELPATDEPIYTTEYETKYESTTAADITTSNEQSTSAPISFDNSKNIPDYPSLSILDYIKYKESLRPLRRAEHNSESSTIPVQSDAITDTTSLAEETSTLKTTGDDTADLIPPEKDASYNSDFATNLESTEHPVEITTLNINIPRAGRGIDFDSTIDDGSGVNVESSTDSEDYSTPVPTTLSSIEDTTASLETKDDGLNITSLEDDQLRNTRDARKNPEDTINDVTVPEDTQPITCISNDGETSCEDVSEEKQPNENVILINLEELLSKRDENNKPLYELPIVLVLVKENDLPVIKIITEDASDERDDKMQYPMLPADESLEPNEYDDKSVARPEVSDLMPSDTYTQ